MSGKVAQLNDVLQPALYSVIDGIDKGRVVNQSGKVVVEWLGQIFIGGVQPFHRQLCTFPTTEGAQGSAG